MPARPPRLWWAPRAWLDGRWAEAVLLQAGSDGCWARISAGTAAPAGAELIDGPVLPGLVNAHSHAFQRAFVGLAERLQPASAPAGAAPVDKGAAAGAAAAPAASTHDDFWSWRDRMYRVAQRITAAQLQAVALHLYHELLQGGYTQVCEFHYLQHDADGAPYADPLMLGQALADAAAGAGIGLTLLPALYQRAGFGQDRLRNDQRRFATDVDSVLRLRDELRARARKAGRSTLLDAGVAIHSLRAAPAQALQGLVQRLADDAGPIHIHIAEQPAEVRDCLAHTGARPIEWLLRALPVDARWQLVHATHATAHEQAAVAASGAGVVLCPGTEANLGDGLCDLPGWLGAGVPLSLGSDSQVLRQWPEEMRWLEYGQRLHGLRRNVAAAAGRPQGPALPSPPVQAEAATAARLFDTMLEGGRRAAGLARWGLQVGARADLLVVNTADDALCGLPAGHLLDGLVFAAAARPFAQVMVAGQWVDTRARAQAAAGMRQAMQALWADA